MKISSNIITICFLLSIAIIGCRHDKPTKQGAEEIPEKTDEFALFKTTEVFDSASKTILMIPVMDRMIPIAADKSLEEKINILLDSVSANDFHQLQLQLLKLEKREDGTRAAIINLQENPGFSIPDSLGNYRSWYDFFQGSAGGRQTGILLTETILQRQYKGEWIDEAAFYYQGKEIGEWDHLSLSGSIKRK